MAIYSEFKGKNMVIFPSYVKLPEGNDLDGDISMNESQSRFSHELSGSQVCLAADGAVEESEDEEGEAR